MAFSSSSVTIGQNTKKSDYDLLLDNTQYNKSVHISLSSTVFKIANGLEKVSLSNYSGTSAPELQAGSVFNNNGTIIHIDTDITPTGYSGIATSTIFYLYYDESASAPIYTSTLPLWDHDKQGWYNGNDRALFAMFKDISKTLYANKNKLTEQYRRCRYVHGSSVTGNDIYLQMAADLPLIGDSMPISGTWARTISDNLAHWLFSRAERTSSTQITLYCVYTTFDISTSAITVTENNQLVYESSLSPIDDYVSLAWEGKI